MARSVTVNVRRQLPLTLTAHVPLRSLGAVEALWERIKHKATLGERGQPR